MATGTFLAPQSLRLKSGLKLDFVVETKMGKDGVEYFPETALVSVVVPISTYGQDIADFLEELRDSAEGLRDVVVDIQYAHEYGGESERLVLRGRREPWPVEKTAIVQELTAKVKAVRDEAVGVEAAERAELARLQAKYS